jgi:hypothetical protein
MHIDVAVIHRQASLIEPAMAQKQLAPGGKEPPVTAPTVRVTCHRLAGLGSQRLAYRPSWIVPPRQPKRIPAC